MSESEFSSLHALVIKTCDDLYCNKQLITKNIVKKMVRAQGDWSEEVLELNLTSYINEWRLQNLAEDHEVQRIDLITQLEAQLCKFRADLNYAHNAINKLKCELTNEKENVSRLRNLVIHELRNMLRD